MPHRLEGPIGCVNAWRYCCYHVSVSLLLRHILRATTPLAGLSPLPSTVHSSLDNIILHGLGRVAALRLLRVEQRNQLRTRQQHLVSASPAAQAGIAAS